TAVVQNLDFGPPSFWTPPGEDADIEVNVPDQPDTYVRCNECTSGFHSDSSVEVDGLDDAQVIMEAAVLNSNVWGATIHGGVARQPGLGTTGRVDGFGSGSDAYRVDTGGHFLIEDGWHDVGQGPLQTSLSGSSV